MALVTPPQIFEGYVYLAAAEPAPSAGIFIPLSSTPDLSAAEADEVTGDGRKVAYALTKEMFERIAALPTEAKPTKLTIVKNTPVGINPNVVRQGFTTNFDLDISASEVSAEV